jgi:hypothetical protein
LEAQTVKLRLNRFRFVRGCIGGSSKSSTAETVNTASGQANIVSGGGVATQSGSIGVGQGGKYLEADATDITGSEISTGINRSNINASQGSTINLGLSADGFSSVLDNLGTKLASAVQSIGGSSSSAGQAADGEPLSYKTIGLLLTAVTAVLGVLYFLFGRKNT